MMTKIMYDDDDGGKDCGDDVGNEDNVSCIKFDTSRLRASLTFWKIEMKLVAW